MTFKDSPEEIEIVSVKPTQEVLEFQLQKRIYGRKEEFRRVSGR